MGRSIGREKGYEEWEGEIGRREMGEVEGVGRRGKREGERLKSQEAVSRDFRHFLFLESNRPRLLIIRTINSLA